MDFRGRGLLGIMRFVRCSLEYECGFAIDGWKGSAIVSFDDYSDIHNGKASIVMSTNEDLFYAI